MFSYLLNDPRKHLKINLSHTKKNGLAILVVCMYVCLILMCMKFVVVWYEFAKLSNMLLYESTFIAAAAANNKKCVLHAEVHY